MEVLKIDEWLYGINEKQFEVFNSKLPMFAYYATRLKDAKFFEVDQLVFNAKNSKALKINYFCNDFIHFMMENGETWKANDVYNIIK